MKTLSAFNTTAIDNPEASPIRLLKLEFTGLTLYLCDRTWGTGADFCVFNGQLYEPVILGWDTISMGRINPVTYEVEPGEARVIINNDIPIGGASRFTALFGDYTPQYSVATISVIFEGASAAGDEITRFVGQIEDMEQMSTDQVTILISQYGLDISNKFSHTIADETTYSDADADEYGKMLPQVYGSAKRVPFLQVAYASGVADFIIGHAVKAIDTVYIRDIVQTTGFIAYTGQSGDENASYPGKACITFTIEDKPFPVSREASVIPVGYPKSLDHNGMILDYDETTTITFQTAPAGNLEDIYVEYSFEIREFGGPSQTMEFYLDGVLVATWTAGALIQFVTSPLRVYKSSWPATATKTKTWRAEGGTGIAFTVLSAIAYAKSDVNDSGPNGRGHTESRQSTNEPLGKITSATTVDAATALTFPTAPAGTLSDIRITYSWDYQAIGDPIFSGAAHHLSIDGINVIWVDTDGTTTDLLPRTFSIRESSWQTSITKTQSRLYEYLRGEALIITSATETAITDLVDYNVKTSGDTVDDMVFGERVSADIQGWQDDGAGTYTGTPAALIERPDHILKHLLIARCGLAAAQLDTTSYTAAGVYYAAQSYTLAVVILQKPNVRMLVNRIAHQAKSIEFWGAGTHHLIHIPTAETLDKTLDDTRIDLGQIWTRYTQRIDILNTLTARYARDWSGYSDNVDAAADLKADRNVVTATDADSVTAYGALEGEQFTYPYITGSNQAQAILDWTKGDLANPRLVVELAGGYYLEDIERGYIIGLSLGTDAERIFFDIDARSWQDRTERTWHKTLETSQLQAAMLDLVTGGYRFRVIDKIYRPDAAQQIQMVEI